MPSNCLSFGVCVARGVILVIYYLVLVKAYAYKFPVSLVCFLTIFFVILYEQDVDYLKYDNCYNLGIKPIERLLIYLLLSLERWLSLLNIIKPLIWFI